MDWCAEQPVKSIFIHAALVIIFFSFWGLDDLSNDDSRILKILSVVLYLSLYVSSICFMKLGILAFGAYIFIIAIFSGWIIFLLVLYLLIWA